MKEDVLRLSETIEMYNTLRNLGILMDPALEKFRSDCNAFVRDGVPSSGKARIPSVDRVLHYDLKVRAGSSSHAALRRSG